MTILLERHEALRAETPHLRVRDAARRLNSTEAALVAAGATGPATPLRPDWPALLTAFRSLGRVMALTRNEHAVHERHGAYEDVSSGPGHILVLGPDIDLRLFPARWAHAYALAGERPSIQIFNRDGDAAHKVFATAETDRTAWSALVAALAAPDAPPPPEAATPAARPAAERDFDSAALRADWLALRNTHDFFPMLHRHKVTRRQALAAAGDDLSLRVDDAAPRRLLEAAAADGLPIMVFVGNRDAIQIHTGPVERLRPSPGGWFNVLDPAFNLHLRETGVASAWRVVKPTEDGIVTSLELLDAAGAVVAQFFGARKPGKPELPRWREIVAATARAGDGPAAIQPDAVPA